MSNRSGNIVYEYFDEGNYNYTENAIRKLMGLTKPMNKENGRDLNNIHSP